MKKIIIVINALIFCSLSLAHPAELGLLEFIKQYIPENPIIIEANACHGQMTNYLCARWPRGMVYAFEPSPKSLPHLQEKALRIANVWVHPLALSATNNPIPYYLCTNNPYANAALAPNGQIADLEFEAPIVVDAITLDDWAELEGVSHVDLLWLGMQGAEFEMLRASKYIFPTVKVIYTQLHGAELRIGRPHCHVVHQWLQSQGFTMVWISNENIEWQATALFIRL
jgi:FkbM family methyltransferase